MFSGTLVQIFLNVMIKKSTLLHLRIPFSLYLLPFFLFALTQSDTPDISGTMLSFFIIHFLFYPASNGFNSYYDKDEESIGGLEHPPPVDKELYYTSMILFVITLAASFLISWQFAVMILGISLVSAAYSHPAVRLKKFPVAGLLTVALFQGGYTYMMSALAINGYSLSRMMDAEVLIPSGLCSLILLGSYPMTQIYQHQEDSKRGDMTFSRLLGIRGTFVWTALIFLAGTAGFIWYFSEGGSYIMAGIFPVFLLPALIYFMWWFKQVLENKQRADFRSTMRLNAYSSWGFILFFLVMMGWRYYF